MKIYSEKQVDIAAILAGPIPPGILIYQNYRALGKEKESVITLAITFTFTITFFYGMMQIPDAILDKIPNFAFTAFYGLIISVFFRLYLAKTVTEAFKNGASKGSNWTVTGITVVGLLLNLLIIFGLAYNQPAYDGKLIKVDGNELYYEEESVSYTTVKYLISALKEVDYFGPEYGNVAHVLKKGDKYIVTMLVDEQFWTDNAFITNLNTMKWMLEVNVQTKVELKLESVSLNGSSKFKSL